MAASASGAHRVAGACSNGSLQSSWAALPQRFQAAACFASSARKPLQSVMHFMCWTQSTCRLSKICSLQAWRHWDIFLRKVAVGHRLALPVYECASETHACDVHCHAGQQSDMDGRICHLKIYPGLSGLCQLCSRYLHQSNYLLHVVLGLQHEKQMLWEM